MNNPKPSASLPATLSGFTAPPTIFWISPLGAGVKNPENRNQQAPPAKRFTSAGRIAWKKPALVTAVASPQQAMAQSHNMTCIFK
jgi:hypothetical protein